MPVKTGIGKTGIGLIAILTLLAGLLVFWYSEKGKRSAAADTVLNSMLLSQNEVVWRKSENAFNARLQTNNNFDTFSTNWQDKRMRQEFQNGTEQFRQVVLATDTLIAYFGKHNPNKTYTLTDQEQLALTELYAQAIGLLHLVDQGCLVVLDALPKQKYSPAATMLLLRAIQAKLLEQENSFLRRLNARHGKGCGSPLFRSVWYNSEILEKGQEGKVMILLNRPNLPAYPKQFLLNNKPLAFTIAIDSSYYQQKPLQVSFAGGYQATIVIPTSEEELGLNEEQTKKWEASWTVPVSYFRDTVITVQGSYKIRRKCMP